MKVFNQQVSQNTLSNRNNNTAQIGFSGSKNFYKHIATEMGLGDWGGNTATRAISENIPTSADFDNKLLNALLKRLRGQKVETAQLGNKSIGLDFKLDEPHKGCNLHFDVDNGGYSAVINGRSSNMTKGSYNQMVVNFTHENTEPTVLARLAEIFGNK